MKKKGTKTTRYKENRGNMKPNPSKVKPKDLIYFFRHIDLTPFQFYMC